MKTLLIDILNWGAMGGYAQYVWSAYSLAFGIIALSLKSQRSQRQRLYKRIRQQRLQS